MPSDADTKLQKDTLVEFDLHDCYALISLANIYCIMARDTKGADEKKKKYYLRAIELFTKVLSLDSKMFTLHKVWRLLILKISN